MLVSMFAFSVQTSAQVQVADTTQKASLIQHVENWYKDNTNYFSITALMAAESSILPVPSEMVIPPAVYVAMEPESDLSIFWIIFFGTIGALIGASFNYIMAMWLGRMVIYKFADSKVGKLFMLSSEKIQKSEKFFNEHGKTSTFIGRLIPVVDSCVYVSLLGERYYVTHGDFFDSVTMTKRWLALLGDVGYDLLLHVNQWLNTWRKRLHYSSHWSLSKYVKDHVKSSVSFITDFESILSEHAKRHHYHGVICGHIHKAEMRDIDGIRYLNCGDWVESCTAIVETYEGEFRIVRWLGH